MPELYPYQIAGVEWIRRQCAEHGAALLADDMGVGKSPQFIAAPPEDAPKIVVVPALLKPQTAERIIQWRGTSTPVRVLDGVGIFVAPRPGEWIVTNPDLLPAAPSEVVRATRELDAAEDEALGELPLDIGRRADAKAATKTLERLAKRGALAKGAFSPGTWLIVDEADEFNTAKTSQTQRLRAVARGVRSNGGRVLGVTATPLRNDPAELRALLATFSLGGVAWPSAKGRALDYWGFMRDWGGSKGRFGEEWAGEPRDHFIGESLRRVMLRRLFRDVVHIPPMLPTERIRVDLDETVRAMADEADAACRRRLEDLRPKERKLVFELVSKVRAALAVAKLPAAHAWCDRMRDEGEPAVVACVSVDAVKSIARREGYGRITGGESPADRARTVAAFQAGELRGVAMTHAAGGVGIDLFRSARILLLSREWNPTRNRQTLARVLRQGQERRVGLSLLLADHAIEERLDALLAGRKRLMTAVDAAAERPSGAYGVVG